MWCPCTTPHASKPHCTHVCASKLRAWSIARHREVNPTWVGQCSLLHSQAVRRFNMTPSPSPGWAILRVCCFPYKQRWHTARSICSGSLAALFPEELTASQPDTVSHSHPQRTNTSTTTDSRQLLTVTPSWPNSAASMVLGGQAQRRLCSLKHTKATRYNIKMMNQQTGEAHTSTCYSYSDCQQMTRLHRGLHTTQLPLHNQ